MVSWRSFFFPLLKFTIKKNRNHLTGSMISWIFILGNRIHQNDSSEFPMQIFLIDVTFTFIALLFGLLIQRVCSCAKHFSHIVVIGTSLIYLFVSVGIAIWQNYLMFLFLPFEIKWKVSTKNASTLSRSNENCVNC